MLSVVYHVSIFPVVVQSIDKPAINLISSVCFFSSSCVRGLRRQPLSSCHCFGQPSRKQTMNSLGQRTKKRKFSRLTNQLQSVQNLEGQLTAAVNAKSSLNALVDLLDIAGAAEDAVLCSKAIFASYRVFVLIINSGMLSVSHGGDSETKTVRMWIQEKLNSYVDLLLGLLQDNESTLRVCLSFEI